MPGAVPPPPPTRKRHRPFHERTVIERDIAATDRRIDLLVYDLYALTPKEIRTVEKAVAQ